MNFIKTFEARVADAFGAAPQGYTAPFSFKKLAKRAAKEMEAETFVIDGVDTAPGLFTVLVAVVDDEAMRPLYPRLTTEIVSFVEAQAAQRGYVFVAEPLARFMVDPSLRSGKFAVFAENVDYTTLERLRDEEAARLSGAAVASDSRQASGHEGGSRPSGRRGVQVMPIATPVDVRPAEPVDGLDVIPPEFAAPGSASVPPTQLRATPSEASSAPADAVTDPEGGEGTVGCLLVDRKSGRTYGGTAPKTPIGRERAAGGIVLRDPNVSRRHAELIYDGHFWRIHDLGSTNGTLVNDVDVTQCVLHDGDLITLGLTNLEFREDA